MNLLRILFDEEMLFKLQVNLSSRNKRRWKLLNVEKLARMKLYKSTGLKKADLHIVLSET